MLGRSIRLEQRKNQLHVALVDPRRDADEPMSLLMQQRAELGARLLVHDPATQVVRNLFIVHDELRANGWPGVESLPLKVIDRGLTEAEILSSDEPSEVLATIIETLREIKVAAEARAAQEALDAEWEDPSGPRGLRHQLRRVRADGAQLGRDGPGPGSRSRAATAGCDRLRRRPRGADRCYNVPIDIREVTKPIRSNIRNAYIDFSKMTLSLVAVVTDVIRDGKPVIGYGFNSNGRYGQGALMRERFLPRLLEADPAACSTRAATTSIRTRCGRR